MNPALAVEVGDVVGVELGLGVGVEFGVDVGVELGVEVCDDDDVGVGAAVGEAVGFPTSGVVGACVPPLQAAIAMAVAMIAMEIVGRKKWRTQTSMPTKSGGSFVPPYPNDDPMQQESRALLHKSSASPTAAA